MPCPSLCPTCKVTWRVSFPLTLKVWTAWKLRNTLSPDRSSAVLLLSESGGLATTVKLGCRLMACLCICNHDAALVMRIPERRLDLSEESSQVEAVDKIGRSEDEAALNGLSSSLRASGCWDTYSSPRNSSPLALLAQILPKKPESHLRFG